MHWAEFRRLVSKAGWKLAATPERNACASLGSLYTRGAGRLLIVQEVAGHDTAQIKLFYAPEGVAERPALVAVAAREAAAMTTAATVEHLTTFAIAPAPALSLVEPTVE